VTDREKINMAIAKLQAAGDIALVAGCELAKIPAVDALEIADLLERLIAEAAASAQTEIVRCRNCRHYNTECCADGCGWCERHDFGTNDEWYCADGEVKE